jgi:hypothetical protein
LQGEIGQRNERTIGAERRVAAGRLGKSSRRYAAASHDGWAVVFLWQCADPSNATSCTQESGQVAIRSSPQNIPPWEAVTVPRERLWSVPKPPPQ